MLEPWQWAAALILALAAGAISGLSGFGAGLMLSAYLLPILGARITVPVLAVAMVLTNAGRVWAFRDSLSLRIALPVLAGVLPGALAGAYAFGALGGAWADLIVGGFLIVSVVLRRALAGQTLAATPLVLAIGGAATGLLSGITTGAGMLLIPLLLGAGLPARALIATDAFVSGSMHVARVAGYAAGGVLGPALVVLGLALGAATVPGSRAAAWLVARIPPWKHVVILEGLVVVIGAMTVWGAVRVLRAA
ncbi:sulfite exporter TauE/SafE family protein [Elioraea tepidiphila]|jgi:uncharacterized membrane protein YfcA|uniref:sulfite exporter TauE/SafE family protein n=1 Tax=Elioraea tepidiphila TaxID=457934 RepID=UPI002FD98AB9